MGLVVAAALLLVLLALATVAAWFVAQGGVVQATSDLAAGRATSAARAWRAGLHLAWRYVGLWLLLAAAGIVVAAAVAAPVAALVALKAPNWLTVVLVLLWVPLLAGLMASAAVGSVVVTFAQRAIVVEDLGAVAALGSGWRLFRTHVGDSLIAWLIGLALALVAGALAMAAVGVAGAVLGAVGVALWAAAGFGAPTIGFGVVAALALVAGLLLAVAISNTFLWSYWTLAYMRLSGRTPAAA